MSSARKGEVRVHVDASPDVVWALVADLDRMGEWSPECYRVEWRDGAASPATPGARFKGWNRYGLMRWSVTCEVKTAEPGRTLSWATLQRGREMTRWQYDFAPADGGTELTESFDVKWLSPVARVAGDWLMRDRDRRRADAMRATLERIKTIAEGTGSAQPGHT